MNTDGHRSKGFIVRRDALPTMLDQRPRYVTPGMGFTYELKKAGWFDEAKAKERVKGDDQIIPVEEEEARLAALETGSESKPNLTAGLTADSPKCGSSAATGGSPALPVSKTSLVGQFAGPGFIEERNQEQAGQLKTLYAEAQNGLRRIVALGLLCHQIKADLKHGEFKPWLEQYCPDLSYRALAVHMQMTERCLEECGFTVKDVLQKCSALHISHGADLFLLPAAEVPAEALAIREPIFELIDGKSIRQLLFGFAAAGKGGFQVSPKELKAFLKQHHPNLAGSSYEELPEKIRAELRKWIGSQRKAPEADPIGTAEAELQLKLNTLRSWIDDIACDHAANPWKLARPVTLQMVKAAQIEFGRKLEEIIKLAKG